MPTALTIGGLAILILGSFWWAVHRMLLPPSGGVARSEPFDWGKWKRSKAPSVPLHIWECHSCKEFDIDEGPSKDLHKEIHPTHTVRIYQLA